MKIFLSVFVLAVCPLLLEAVKIVSLSPALSEAVFLLGRGDLLIARSSACCRPEEITALPVAGAFGEIDAERIISFKPDMVIADTVIDLSLIRPLEEAGIKFHLLPCGTFQEYLDTLAELGSLTGAEQSVAEVIGALEEERRLIEPLPVAVKTLWVVWQDPVIIAGENTLPDDVMQITGLVNTADIKGYFKPSAEWLLQCNAQLIIINQDARELAGEEIFRYLPAVRRNRIIRLPADTPLERPCREFITAARELRDKIEGMLE